MHHPVFSTAVMLVILLVAVPLMSIFIGRRFRAAAPIQWKKIFRYIRTMIVLWSLTALAVYALRLHGLQPWDVGLRPPRYPVENLVGLAVVAVILVASAARRTVQQDYARAIRGVIPISVIEWICFVPLAATAALCEEFLYRGYALSVIAALSGSVPLAALVSSLAFGLGHAYQGRAGVFGATMSGLIYSGMFLLTGSLWPCMLGHFTQDIAGALLLGRALKSREGFNYGFK